MGSGRITRSDRLYTLGAVVLISVAVGALAAPARSHDGTKFHNLTWIRDTSVNWMFTDTFPTGAWRDRVKEADGPWNAIGAGMYFVKQSQVNDFNALECPSTYQKNGIHIGSIDGTPSSDNTLARTYKCKFSGTSELYSAQIKFDEAEAWYTGDATPPPSDKFDVEAIATHEFGHATGWSGHFLESGTHCTDTPKETMCPTIPSGKAYWRTLETHDKHTLVNAY
ncbi:MAG: matrixin family metalloprotease [Actinomycetota bacterium]